MSDSQAGRARSRTGCATVLGVLLVVLGSLALWINLEGAEVLVVLLDLVPHAAVWWPAVLIAWGAWKLAARLRTGTTRFGVLEILLLLIVVGSGLALTTASRLVGESGFQLRLREIGRWAREQTTPLPEHVFVSERRVPLPAVAPLEVAVSLPAGAIVVEAVEPPPVPAPSAAGDAQPEAGAAPKEPPSPPRDERVSGETQAGAPSEVFLRLTRRIRAESRGAAAREAERVRLEIGPLKDGSSFPVSVSGHDDRATGVDLLVRAPPGVRVSAVSGRGPVRVQGPFGAVHARTSRGPIEAAGIRGEVALHGRDGPVNASAIAGPLTIRSSRGMIQAESVEGPVYVESDHGPVWIRDASDAVTVRATGGPIQVAASKGPIRVEARVAPVTVRDIAGTARVQSDHGPVTAHRIQGDLDIAVETATVEVRDAGAAVAIQNRHGEVVLVGAAGEVRVQAGSGDLLASDLAAATVISGGSGDILVRGFRAALEVNSQEGNLDLAAGMLNGNLDAATASGDIRLGLPDSASFSLRVANRGREPESSVPLEPDRSAGASWWIGSAGTGEPVITLAADSGDIEIHTTEGGPAPAAGGRGEPGGGGSRP